MEKNAIITIVASAFCSPLTISNESKSRHLVPANRCDISASLQPSAFSIDFNKHVQSGSFGAVYFGQYNDPDNNGIPQDVVLKFPVESQLGQQLYEMERHTNLKLSKSDTHPRRYPTFLGELSFPPEQQMPFGIAPSALVWQRVEPAETLERFLSTTSIDSLASAFGTSAAANPLRRTLCAALLRELALIVSDLQSSGIVHRYVFLAFDW